MHYIFQSNAMKCAMAMFSQLRYFNIMYYITEMHVMPITFQLLLHDNKFKLVGYFKT